MPATPRHIVHVTQQLSTGGAGRATVTLARASATLGGHRHTILSLQPPPPAAVRLANAAGVPLVTTADATVQDRLVADADLVLIHFWNSPELYGFLRRPGPSRRTVAWLHVNGLVAPHIVTPALVDHCDAVIATTSRSLGIPAVRAAIDADRGAVIPATTDPTRLQAAAAALPPGFRIGTVCGLDFTKLHRDFVAICASVRTPAARFIVCGDGPARETLMAEARRAGLGNRIEFRGHVEDVGGVLAGLDVFLYPLRPDNTTTCDLALQEALVAGVPAVVMPHGGAADLVEHEQTGLVAESVAACAAAIERLHEDESLRMRLATTAARRGRADHDPRQMATRMHAVFADVCGRPKRSPGDPLPPLVSGGLVDPESGAALFVRSLGEHAGPFATALATDASSPAHGLDACDAAIAGVGPLLAGAGGGGVLHYRGFHPDDARLRLWSGLVLQGQGRPAIAALEFQAARRLGLDPARARRHLDNAVAAAREPAIAYLGNSLTAQKEGYRPALHARLEALVGRKHRAINAGIGGVGSLGCGFLLPELVLRHGPQLCFVECTTADMGGATPIAAVGPAIDGIVGRLLDAGVSVCLLHMPRAAAAGIDPRVLPVYEQVADHYGVSSIDVGRLLTAERGSQPLEPDILFDGIHTSPAGASLIADLVAPHVAHLLSHTTGSRRATAEPLHPDHLRNAEIVPALPTMCDDANAALERRFKLAMPCLSLATGNRCSWGTVTGEIMGLLVVVGPESGVIEITIDGVITRVQLWDGWCDRERLQVVILDRPCPAGVPVHVAMTAADSASRGACGNSAPDSRSGTSLTLAGFLVRRFNAAPAPRLLAG